MEEALVTALLWLGFGGTHVGLTLPPIRSRLVGALGEGGYIVAYSIVAIATFGALVHYVARHRHAGPQTSLLVTIPPVHGALLVISFLGFSLFIASVLVYPSAPMAVFRHRAPRARGIQQVTRHPFFSGVALWAIAHALLAPSKVTFVFFVGAIVLAWVGAIHQDRRLVEELGEPYRRYVASTSFFPFVAILRKRQKVQWAEQPWVAYALGFGSSLALYHLHDHIFARGGAYVIGVVSLGSIVAILSSKARSVRQAEANPDV